jgi:hypothetical protein
VDLHQVLKVVVAVVELEALVVTLPQVVVEVVEQEHQTILQEVLHHTQVVVAVVEVFQELILEDLVLVELVEQVDLQVDLDVQQQEMLTLVVVEVELVGLQLPLLYVV